MVGEKLKIFGPENPFFYMGPQFLLRAFVVLHLWIGPIQIMPVFVRGLFSSSNVVGYLHFY